MKITNESQAALGGPWAQLGGDPTGGEGEVPIDCCNPGTDPPPDRAEDQDVFTVNSPATGGIVQQKVGAYHAPAGAFTLSFDTTPTNGNTMVAFVFGTDGNAAEVTTSGWTKRQEGTANGDHVEIWTKVAGAAEPTGVSLGVVSGSNTVHRLVLFEVAGSYDTSAHETDQSASSPLTGPSITAAADGVLLSAFIGQVATYMGDPTWTPQGGLIEDSFLRQSPGRLVSWVGHLAVVAGAYDPSLTTTALYSGRLTANAAIIIGATPTAVEWNVPAPNTVDDDDATYQEIEGEDVLQIDLGGPFRIVRSRLLVGADDAGTRTYQIGGANEADFSDLVTLGSISFAATGSFTPDDLDLTWTTDQSYRYFQLTGSDENRRVFSWELYEPDTSQGQDHTHDSIEAEIASNSAALDAHVSEILTHLTAETDDTLVLAPDGLGGVEFRAETGGGMTNPMTTAADLIVGGVAGAPARLAKGSDGQVLTVDPTTHLLVWATPSSGFSDPMTSRGDIIIRNASNVTARLAKGGADTYLGSDGTDVAYSAVTDAKLSTSDITTNNVVSTKHGFAPKSPSDATKFLNGAATPDYAQVLDSDLSTSDITTNDASTSKHGFLKKLDNSAGHYMDGTGAWSTPAGTYAPPTLQSFVQTAEAFQSGATTCVVTITPTNGNRMIAFVGANGRGVTSVTQTNVTWTQLYTGNDGTVWTEIWIGVVNASPGTTATFNFASSTRSQIIVKEVTNAYSAVGTAVTATGGVTFLAAGPLTAAAGAQVIGVIVAASGGSGTSVMSCPFTLPTAGGQARMFWGTSIGTPVTAIAINNGGFQTRVAMMVLS